MSPQIDPPSPDLILTPREILLANLIELVEKWRDEDNEARDDSDDSKELQIKHE